PDIAPDGALLVRQGDDVVAYRPDSLAATGRVKGGGADLWMLTGWRPRGAYRGAFGDAGAQPDQGAASDTAGPQGPMDAPVSPGPLRSPTGGSRWWICGWSTRRSTKRSASRPPRGSWMRSSTMCRSPRQRTRSTVCSSSLRAP